MPIRFELGDLGGIAAATPSPTEGSSPRISVRRPDLPFLFLSGVRLLSGIIPAFKSYIFQGSRRASGSAIVY